MEINYFIMKIIFFKLKAKILAIMNNYELHSITFDWCVLLSVLFTAGERLTYRKLMMFVMLFNAMHSPPQQYRRG